MVTTMIWLRLTVHECHFCIILLSNRDLFWLSKHGVLGCTTGHMQVVPGAAVCTTCRKTRSRLLSSPSSCAGHITSDMHENPVNIKRHHVRESTVYTSIKIPPGGVILGSSAGSLKKIYDMSVPPATPHTPRQLLAVPAPQTLASSPKTLQSPCPPSAAARRLTATAHPCSPARAVRGTRGAPKPPCATGSGC